MSFLAVLRHLPWLTHAVTVAVVFGYLLAAPLHTYGLQRAGHSPLGLLMSWGFLVVPVAAAIPLGLLEAYASANGVPWLARVAALVGSAFIAWVASLPVQLRFFASRDPVEHDQVEMAVASLAVMLLGQLLALVLASAVVAASGAGGPASGLGAMEAR